MPEPVIRLEGVKKSYGAGAEKQLVLRDVSLSIDKGEFVAIVGTSGSGKSTLLNIIGGLDRDYTGLVEVEKQDLRKLPDRQLALLRNQRIGFIFQAFNLLDHLTCAENVSLPSFFAPTTKDVRERALRALERVGIKDKADRKPSDLSGGQKQRVAIARALFNAPGILLCDEPTGNLDSETGQQIIELFHALNREDGISMVIVTHEERVSRTARRVIRIEDGRIVDASAAYQRAAGTPGPAGDDKPAEASKADVDSPSQDLVPAS
jgi:putative ABC transport system ATP-binding protein